MILDSSPKLTALSNCKISTPKQTWITLFSSDRLHRSLTNNDKSAADEEAMTVWQQCLDHLSNELSSQQINTWLKPLQAVHDTKTLRLFAPNRFVMERVHDDFLSRICEIVNRTNNQPHLEVKIEVGNLPVALPGSISIKTPSATAKAPNNEYVGFTSNLNAGFTFDAHVEGKSNQLARAAAKQVAANPGSAYNPLFIYGGVGLGKTHLMQAAGNVIVQQRPSARVAYIHAERFVADMVKALQHNKINEFKRFYRNLDTLLVDDIQFFIKKERSQEEFFHTFNALLEGQGQVILTADRFPKELEGVEERLISRFGSGLTVSIDPPELETRVAILMKKAESEGTSLPDEVAFFIAKHIRSNVRELEGALRRVVASAYFTGRQINVDLAAESLKDLLSFQERQVTINNIQKTVAEYFNMRISDLHNKSRARHVARPRQLAMALTKELTTHSLPEIGDAFGGRDHTTVLHACRKIKELLLKDSRIQEDYDNLLRNLST